MSTSNDHRLSQDDAFDLLSSPRRRYVIHHLQQTDGPVDLGRLADEVASWENDTPEDDLTSQQRKRVYVSLYQTHIPKLEEFGIVTYDADDGTVVASNRLDDVGRYLDDGEGDDVRWDVYYLVLAVASAVVYATVALDVVELEPVADVVVAGAIMAAFLAVAVVHWVSIRQAEGLSLGTLFVD